MFELREESERILPLQFFSFVFLARSASDEKSEVLSPEIGARISRGSIVCFSENVRGLSQAFFFGFDQMLTDMRGKSTAVFELQDLTAAGLRGFSIPVGEADVVETEVAVSATFVCLASS